MEISRTASILLDSIKEKRFTVGVIGLGYVGLPLALEYALAGINTIGFEISQTKVDLLNSGVNYNQDLLDDTIRKAVVEEKKLSATSDFSLLANCDAIFICVPTPFTPNKEPDISYIISAAESIKNTLRKGQIIILKSTTFPGTTEKYVQPILDKTGLRVGEDYFLAFSPERIDPGNKKWNTKNTPIVVGGATKICTEISIPLIGIAIDTVVPVSSPSVAEMEKLLENIFRSVNIALVNELAKLCDRIGINVWEVVEAASTKPFGFMPFYPGPGIGGHCILIDPYYLAWMAREKDFVTKFVTLAAEINEDMPFYVRSMVIREVSKQPVTMKTAKVLLLGMAFKKDVDDLRHSPALKLAELLYEDGFNFVDYFDPFIPLININGKEIKSIEALNENTLKFYDIVVITTDHSLFDINSIVENSKVVIDTRNACKAIFDRENIVLIGDGKL